MKKVLLASMFLLLQLAAHAQDTKYTVTLNVPEDGTLSAYAYGKSTYDRRSEYAAGEEVHLTGSLRSEYSFVSWTDEQGRVVCDSLRYTFTMPARNVTLTGHTEYDPENPPGPREDGYTDTWNRLYLRSNPSYGGAFTWGLGAESAQNWLVWTGYEFTVQAYPATGFTFVGWQLDGEIVSTDNPYTFIMPERDMTLYAMYEYDPETPVNPYANKWDKESGELIMTDFRMGHLYEDVMEVTRRDPWHSDWSLVKSATIAGQCTDEKLTYDYPIDCRAITSECNNLEFLDYSRTSGITKFTDGCFSIKSLKQVVLPATTLSIGKYAFRGCESLTTVTCFATTPPVFEGKLPDEQGSGNNYYYAWAFDGLTLDNIIVHVPAEAVPLYQEARGWKELMILPITQGVQKLTVSLPQAQRYKDMFLELVNTKTLQSQRYVITGNTTYTFNNLIKDTQHTLYLKNQRGDVLGSIEGIDIKDKDVQVSFADLKTPIDVTVKLMLPNGNYLPSLGEGSGVGITWTDRQGNYLGQGATLPQQMSGTQVQCRVRLKETLGRQYQNPADTLFEVGQNSSLITYHLSLIPQVQLAGTVTAASTEKPVRNAVVNVSQMLNGAYAVTQSTKTDIDGRWSLTVYDAPTTVTVSHTDYLKQSITLTELSSLGEGQGVDLALKDITGTIVNLDLSYTAAVADGEESVTEEGYSGYDNISYTVYDETHGQELTDISSQYPILVLIGDELPLGTRLRITATSITDDFMPITTTCTVGDDAHATAIFAIKEMGQLKANFEMTDNMSVMGVLYDGDGQQVGWAPYKDTELTATHLKDGDYTLITMGYSELFTSVSSLDNLLSLHGMDDQQMVKNEVSIRSGHITTVTNHIVPVLDEDRFRYTSDATSVSVNKSEVTVGSYVTVRAELGFKPAYVDALSKVRLQFDIPEGCEFVENSMMVGNKAAAYEVDDRRITVLIEDLNDMVRFCVVPTQGGLHEISAGTRFRINGTTTIQPIGAVTFSAEDLTINVPETTGRRLLPVTGMAVPLSQVEVFDGGISIGQTTAIGTGYFSVMCPLNNPYNLSEHDIYAVITTPEGMQMQSETKIVKIDRGSVTPVVTMRFKGLNHEHNIDDFVFDFRNNTVTPGGMNMRYADSNFEVEMFVDFYDQNDMLVNDTTVIRDVKLYILRERRDVLTVDAPYCERHKCWEYTLGEASDYSVGHNLPVNVDLDYNVVSNLAFDRQEFDDRMTELLDYFEEGRQHMLGVWHMFDDDDTPSPQQPVIDELWSMLDDESLDTQRLRELTRTLVGDSIMDATAQKYVLDYSEIDYLLARSTLTSEEENRLDSLLDVRATQFDALPIGTLPDSETLQLLLDGVSLQFEALKDARDSLMYVNALLFYPDTTAIQLPNGDMSLVIPGADGRYEKFEITNLTSVNREQLMADGYTEVPTVDGTPFYFLQTEDTYCLIDAKNMKRYYRQVVAEADVPQARRAGEWWNALLGLSPSLLFPKGCGDELDNMQRHITKGIAQMKEAQGFIAKLEAFTTNVLPIFSDAVDIFCCIYDSGRAALDKHFKDYYKKTGDQVYAAQKQAEAAYDKARKAMSDLTSQMGELGDNINRYKKHNNILENRLKQPGITNKQIWEWRNKINSNLARIDDWNRQLANLKKNFSGLKESVDKAFKGINRAADEVNKFLKNQKFVTDLLDKFPVKLIPDEKLVKKLPKAYFAIPIAGWFLKCFPVACVIVDNVFDGNEWIRVNKAIHAVLPCYGNEEEAQKLVNDCERQFMMHMLINFGQIGIDVTSLFVEAGSFLDPKWCFAKLLDVASCVIAVFHPDASTKDRKALEARLDALRCKPDPDPDPNPDINDPNGDWVSSGGTLFSSSVRAGIHPSWNFPKLWFVRDPAGYVYEAVNSNRVEGVTTTCYYKETKEDMYGDFHDEAVIWDASLYAQENPLFTDAEGRYQWDVPQGLWQVKYEKQGYETTYSDWLPVPPPQLEVNVGITQMKQPNVAKVKAYTNGIDITFDKYMRPNTLKTENIFVTKGGQIISGKIELLNAESGYQTPDSVYASKVRFIANDNLNANDKIQLTIKKAVESYAGIPMEQDFTQQFDVELRIEALIADSLVNLAEHQEATILVKAVPAQAAKGKKVTVATSDDPVVTIPASLTLDQNGEAKLTVKAEAQGTSVVRFTMTDEELTTTTLVTVRNPEQMQVAAPRASRINGTTLYKGTEIRLTCATSRATILYTLDGSCPCAPESGKVTTYTAPIVITGDSIVIKAMAIAPGMEDSPVVAFSYKGIERPVGIEAPAVPDDSPVPTEPVLFFRLNGQRITQPERGVTIERHGSQVRKVVTK